jgi:heat shock protein HslJ
MGPHPLSRAVMTNIAMMKYLIGWRSLFSHSNMLLIHVLHNRGLRTKLKTLQPNLAFQIATDFLQAHARGIQNKLEMKMNRKTLLSWAGFSCAAFLLSACQSTSNNQGSVKNLYVGPAMADGTGVGPMTCLMVKDTPDGKYGLFYSPIAGFDYVPGFEYVLEVKVTELDPVPADASKYEYTLMNMVFKAPAGLAIDSTAWKLSGYESVSGTMEPPVHNSTVNLRIGEGRVSGNAGANRFFGDCSLNGSRLTIKTVGSSMMMGTPELMAQENQFLKLLGESVDYQIVGKDLR